jgi:hypothetical protein
MGEREKEKCWEGIQPRFEHLNEEEERDEIKRKGKERKGKERKGRDKKIEIDD